MKVIRIFATVLVLVMLLAITACGSEKDEPYIGLYEAEYAEYDEQNIALEGVFDSPLTMKLEKNGRAVFEYDGETYNMSYTLAGEVFKANASDVSLEGTLSGNTLRLENILDSGVTIIMINHANEKADDSALIVVPQEP